MNRNYFSYMPVLIVVALSACSPNKQQALGSLVRDRVSLLATSNEIIDSLPIKEGSHIKKGDILVQFNTRIQQAIVDKAIAEQVKAQTQLDKLLNGERIEDVEAAKAELNRAKASAIDSEKSYQRLQQLVSIELAPQSSLDNALAARDAAQSVLAAATQNWKKLAAGARVEDIAQAQANLQAAQADVALEKHKLQDLSVVASRDGILDSLPYNQGERVPTNGIVAIIQTNNIPYARVYIPAPFRSQLAVGKQLKVHVDGIAKPITGTIRWLSVEPAFTPYNSMSEQDRSRLVYLSKIDLPDTSQSLPAGIPVQVDLEPLDGQ